MRRGRFQFGLAGLLGLFAAAAVAVKLWYGPHHVSLPVDQVEGAAQIVSAWGDATAEHAVVEYDYVNTPEGPAQRSGRDSRRRVLGRFDSFRRSADLRQPVSPRAQEWIRSIGMRHTPLERERVEIVYDSGHDAASCYLICENGVVYRFSDIRIYFFAGCEPIDPREIENETLRNFVLAKQREQTNVAN
ncbi:MAG: hypothetical protein QM811_02020 [Pirellulales bacterium]